MLKPKTTISTTSTKPVVLPNGIKLHVQPQNLLLATNLAGMSQGPVINQIVSRLFTRSEFLEFYELWKKNLIFSYFLNFFDFKAAPNQFQILHFCSI